VTEPFPGKVNIPEEGTIEFQIFQYGGSEVAKIRQALYYSKDIIWIIPAG
jgi:hypothetical protein